MASDTSLKTEEPKAGATPFVMPLGTVAAGDVRLAGGKAANLGELMRAGLPTPDGFVVATPAYDLLVRQNRLADIVARLSAADGDGRAVREAIEKAPVPENVRQSVLDAYRRMGQGPVAVRSSATAEDLPGESFAGQMDTFLNVNGETQLLASVRHCWASLWSDRAITYRHRNNIENSKVKMAVLVLRMVPADVAGVLFTVNPVTGAMGETVVEANPGLGEGVVSGAGNPDHFVLRRRPYGWIVTGRRTGKRSAPTEATLTDGELRKLAGLGRDIERHFGTPQDVEWAVHQGKIYIVQARPMTAVPEPPLHPGWIQRTAAGMLSEVLPERPYPLEATSWTPIPIDALGAMVRPLGVRIPRFKEVFIVEDAVVVRSRGKIRLGFMPWVAVWPFTLFYLARRYNCVRWREDPLLARAVSIPAELSKRDLKNLDWRGLIETVRESMSVISPCLGELRRRYLPPAIEAIVHVRIQTTLLGRGRLFPALISGVRTKTLETNDELEAMAATVREDPTLHAIFTKHGPGELRAALTAGVRGQEFLSRVDAFLDCYGHRETQSMMLIYPPTWKESPEIPLAIIKDLAQSKPPARPERPAWERARDDVLQHPVLRVPALRNHFLRRLEQARCFTAIREDTRFYAELPLPEMRQAFLEMGRRLAAAGALDSPIDVFHLTLDELESVGGGQWPPKPDIAASLRAAAGRRKQRRAALGQTPLLDPRLLQDKRGDDALVSGAPSARGVATGQVRIVRDVSEFDRLKRGEILVAPYTNPAWTPLFQRAAAVVVDSGGPASHAAIIAREYGVPAVMGTIDGTSRLHDGQKVRVDGTAGKVFKAEGD